MDAGGQLGREQSDGYRGPVGCSHARGADLVCDGEGKEAKGPGSSLGQETGEDIAGTRVVPTEPCFITRARLRARGDLTEKVDCRRFWGGRTVSPWSLES